MKILFISLVLFFAIINSYFFLTNPVVDSLKSCIDKVSDKQESFCIKVQKNELSNDQVKHEYNAFVNDLYRCKAVAQAETRRPSIIVDLVFGLAFRGK